MVLLARYQYATGDIQGTLQCITDGCSLHETVSLRNQHGRLVCGVGATSPWELGPLRWLARGVRGAVPLCVCVCVCVGGGGIDTSPNQPNPRQGGERVELGAAGLTDGSVLLHPHTGSSTVP